MSESHLQQCSGRLVSTTVPAVTRAVGQLEQTQPQQNLPHHTQRPRPCLTNGLNQWT